MRHAHNVVILILAAVLVAACSPGGGDTPGSGGAADLQSDVEHVQVSPGDASGFETVVERCTAMGLTALAFEAQDNMVYSPLSWCMALGMLAGGTTNAARDEVEAAFGVSVEEAQEALNALAGELAAFEADPGSIDDDELPESPAVHRATNVVVHEGYEVKEDYLDSLARYFDAGMMEADLTSPESKEILSEWVRHHTGGRIEESAIEPNPDLVMVLQDALLFAAAWDREFQPSTSTMEFTNLDGSVASVDQISDLREIDYAETEGWQAGRLGLGADFTATFILGPDAEAELTPERRAGLLGGLEPVMVDLVFPKFELEGTTELRDLMPQLGLRSLLDGGTLPLEDIAEGDKLHVGQAAQQAMIKVSESGVVGAAVTEIGVEAESAPVPGATLHLDRPFYLLITHTDTDTDLFQVAVRDLGDA